MNHRHSHFLLPALMTVLVLPAFAQAPQVPAVPIQGSARPPVPSANTAETPADPATLGETKIVEDIVFPKLNGADLAGLYRRYTGRRVIVTTAAASAEFAFVQEASPESPLTFAEAAELLRKAAVLEGFVFTLHPDDPNLDILTLASGGPKPTNVNVDVFSDLSKLPDEDKVITYVMKLEYIKPEQAVQIFTQIIGQIGAYGSISAVPNASAVVITEKASLIRTLAGFKDSIDTPGSVLESTFIPVLYADASELATVLNEMLTTQQSSQTTAGVQRAAATGAVPPPPVPGATPNSGASSGAGETTPVQIVPDARTNRIFVMGRKGDLDFVRSLVAQFDIATSEKSFLRRKLRFLTVADFLPVAGDALARAFSGTGSGSESGASTNPQSRARPTSSPSSNMPASNNTSGFNSRNNRNNSSFGGSSGFGGSGFGGGGTGSSLSDPDIDTAPESMLVGRTLLVADNITNSILVQGPPPALKVIEELLEQLDVKPQQVMISSVIGQLTLNKTRELGFNYLVDSKDVRGGGGGAGFNTVTPTTGTFPFPEFNPQSLATSGLRVYGQIGDLSAYLKALTSKTDFTVLSRPSIFTSNNKKGVISSGERIAIPTEGGTSTGSFSSGTRIQYEDVVLKLEVIPLVNSNDEITMQIALLNDEQNGTQTISGAGTDGGDLTVPRISTREILTTVTVPNNETIVLGGLITGKKDKQKSGIPILSEIPVVGNLFGSNSNIQDRSELMVFIQPSLISDDASLNAVQDDMGDRYSVSGSTQGFADGESDWFGGKEQEPPAEEATSSEESRRNIRPVHRR